jgi:hypothetical protein
MEFKDMKVLLPTKSNPKVRKAVQDTGAQLTPSMHLAIRKNIFTNNNTIFYDRFKTNMANSSPTPLPESRNFHPRQKLNVVMQADPAKPGITAAFVAFLKGACLNYIESRKI